MDDSKRTEYLREIEEQGVYQLPETKTLPKPDVQPFVSSFIDHLVSKNIISAEIAAKAASDRGALNGKGKRSIVELLAEKYGIPRDTLYDEVAKFYSFRVVDIHARNGRRLPAAMINKLLSELPEPVYQLAIKFKVLPFEVAFNRPDKLLVVTPYPSEREIHDVARAFPYPKFEICYIKEKDFAEVWRFVTLERQKVVDGAESIESLFEETEAELDSILDREINRGQLVSLVEDLFTDAVRVGASDIHIFPQGARKTRISFRIDGNLTDWYTIEGVRSEAVIAVIKGRGLNLDRFERMAAQDGSAQKMIDNQLVRFRISVLPIISKELGGKLESMVIRILKDADASISLENVGFDSYSLEKFELSINQPHGMVILTGPTGSGKSTTLVAALRSVMSPALNTISVEDPVEYLIEGARQVKLNHKLSFEDAIRAILRHDPDIVMVGEIRDKVTADIAIKLANTGHLTFSTLHTNDATSVVSRLFKIGVEPFLIAQAMNIVVAQRLVRKLCERCKAPVKSPSPLALIEAGFTADDIDSLALYRPVGCVDCNQGFRGRTAIHESLYFTNEIRNIILDSGEKIDIGAIRECALKDGMQTLRRSGLALVKKGITTIDEVIANTTKE